MVNRHKVNGEFATDLTGREFMEKPNLSTDVVMSDIKSVMFGINSELFIRYSLVDEGELRVHKLMLPLRKRGYRGSRRLSLPLILPS